MLPSQLPTTSKQSAQLAATHACAYLAPSQLLVRSKWSAALRLQHYGVGDKFAVAIGRGYVTAIQCWWLVWLTECGARVMSQAEIAAKLGVRGTLPGAVRAAAVLRGF